MAFPRAFRIHHGCGLLIILLLAAAPYVPALAARPTALRNASVIAFDLTFIAPLLLSGLRGRIRPAAPATLRSAPDTPQAIRIRTIALIAALAYAATWLAGPATQADFARPWFATLSPLIAAIRTAHPIAGIEQDFLARGLPEQALLAGNRLALLWILPGLAVLAGFLLRWAAMGAGQAAAQCARNRARFTGADVLRKLLDRAIVVLFVLNLPMANVATAGADPAIEALARSIAFLAVSGRGATLAMLAGIALDWLLAELLTRRASPTLIAARGHA